MVQKKEVQQVWKKLVEIGAKYGGTFDTDKKIWGRKRISKNLMILQQYSNSVHFFVFQK